MGACQSSWCAVEEKGGSKARCSGGGSGRQLHPLDVVRVSESTSKAAAEGGPLHRRGREAKEAEDEDAVALAFADGCEYLVSRRFLVDRVPGSMLGRMFAEENGALVDVDALGRVTIGRGGAAFGEVLRLLEDGDAAACRDRVGHLGDFERSAVLEDLDYFGLDDAVLGATRGGFFDTDFRRGPTMGRRRAHSHAAVEVDGRVYVVGGDKPRRLRGNSNKKMKNRRLDGAPNGTPHLGVILHDVDVLDFENMAFETAPRSVALGDRTEFRCVAMPGTSRAAVIGGRTWTTGAPLRTSVILDLKRWTVEPGPRLLTRRRGFGAVALEDGRALVVGGVDDRGATLHSTEILDLSAGTATAGPLLLDRRSRPAVTMLNGRVWVLGGFDGRKILDSTEVLRFDAPLITKAPPHPRDEQPPTAGDDGDDDVTCVATSSWELGPRMRRGRWNPGVAVLDARRLVVVGGLEQVLSGGPVSLGRILRSTEVLDVEAWSFSAGPRLSEPRRGCVALPLKTQALTGGCLVFGGEAGKLSGVVASTDLLLPTRPTYHGKPPA